MQTQNILSLIAVMLSSVQETQWKQKIGYPYRNFPESGIALTSGKTAAEKHAALTQISLAWMLCKHKNLAAIPGTRKSERLQENAGAAEIELTPEELAHIDCTLNHIKMSEVFGGSKILS